MNKRFILKGIVSLYQTFNLLQQDVKNNSFFVNSINKSNWFDMSYNNINNLALLSHNVYYENDSKWYNTTFNNTSDISIDHDTVNAYLFSSEDYKTHIISIKGTSTFFGKNINVLNSVYNDKLNDNLFYSCCFYKQSNLFNKIDELNNQKCWENENENDQIVFDNKKEKCKSKCFSAMNKNELNYISITKNIIDQLKLDNKFNIDFQNHEIIFTGHSLGGSLATVMGVIFNKPAISFQSPGIKHFLEKSNILKNYKSSNFDNIYNFGHNADIIFKGKCNGKLSLCYLGGYNVETKCHIGKVCEYDAINKLNISESIFTHKLKYVIKNIIPYWENDFPECKIDNNCADCEKWSFLEN